MSLLETREIGLPNKNNTVENSNQTINRIRTPVQPARLKPLQRNSPKAEHHSFATTCSLSSCCLNCIPEIHCISALVLILFHQKLHAVCPIGVQYRCTVLKTADREIFVAGFAGVLRSSINVNHVANVNRTDPCH